MSSPPLVVVGQPGGRQAPSAGEWGVLAFAVSPGAGGTVVLRSGTPPE